MDLSDINKIAKRKRMGTDVEKLREKVARESSKIIKLRVAQDTAYWDLKEKLSGVESAHERLQQNMLDVQMQHETLSAQYQDELRLRPETLNKLRSTREICDVLEEYVGRLRGSLRSAAADHAALTNTYAGAALRVQAAQAQHTRVAEHAQMHAAALRDKLVMSTEHGARVADMAAQARRQGEAAESAARAQLLAAADVAAELRARCDQLAERAATAHAALHDRERVIAVLQREAEQRAADASAEAEQSAELRAALQRELESYRAALAAAEARGVEAAREAASAQLELTATEERATRLSDETAKLNASLQNMESTAADLKRELESFGAKYENLQKEFEEKDREGHEYAARAETAQRELEAIRVERENDAVRLRSALAELEAEREAHASSVAAAKEEQKLLLERSTAAAAEAERTLAERAETVARLIRDVTAEAAARAHCESALSASRADLEAEARAKDDLNNNLQNKETELAGQMKVILEIRNEKERLQGIIRGMQATIDNIQKELTRESPAATVATAARREPPEHDDNARPAPSKLHKLDMSSKPLKGNRGLFLAPKPRPAEDINFHFLSDSSVDGDVIDQEVVNARFEAMQRGEVPPPIPLSALKRRRPEHSSPQSAARPPSDELPLSQLKADPSARARSFFRTKRCDRKAK